MALTPGVAADPLGVITEDIEDTNGVAVVVPMWVAPELPDLINLKHISIRL